MEKALLDERNRLQSEVGQKAKFQRLGDSEDDNVLQVEQIVENVGLTNRLKDLLLRVERSLKRIRSGAYGICVVCHGPIERSRLQILPTAENCASCKPKQGERGRR